MYIDQKMLMSVLLLPFAGALIVLLLPARRSIITGFFVLLTQLVCSFPIINTMVGCGPVQVQERFRENTVEVSILNVFFRCTSLSYIFALTSIFVGVVIYLFSLGYFKEEKVEEQKKFSFWGLLFIGSMMGVIFSDNLISLYLFWELAGLCSWKLIGFYRKDEHLLKADKAFLITSAGAGLMMLSFACIYAQTGTLSLSQLSCQQVSPLVFTLFFIGVLTKSASFPFHTWLPDASVAPTPVTAFLHAAVLVKIGVYGLFKIFVRTLLVSGWTLWAGWLALFSSIVAGIIALREEDIKKILAFSTVSQLGLMIAGLMVFNMTAAEGVLIFYFAHALGKGGLFLCAGVIERVFGTKNIKEMGGLMKRAPVLTFAFFIGMLSVIGIPPLPGFFGKLNIIMGMLESRQVFYALFAILSSILTLLYLFRLFLYVFMGEKREELEVYKTKFKPMLTSVLILAIVAVLLGIGLTL